MSPLQRPTVDPKRYYSTIKAFLFYGVLNNTEIAVLWGKLHGEGTCPPRRHCGSARAKPPI